MDERKTIKQTKRQEVKARRTSKSAVALTFIVIHFRMSRVNNVIHIIIECSKYTTRLYVHIICFRFDQDFYGFVRKSVGVERKSLNDGTVYTIKKQYIVGRRFVLMTLFAFITSYIFDRRRVHMQFSVHRITWSVCIMCAKNTPFARYGMSMITN